MRIINRYITEEFFLPFLSGILLFTLIIIFPQILDKIGTFLKHKVTFATACRYFAYQIPSIFVSILPVAVLLATLFSLGHLAKNNEITAMKIGGVSLYQIITPVLLAALLISIFSIIFSELVVPRANETVKEIEKKDIYKKKATHQKIRKDISFIDSANRKYYIGLFDSKNSLLKDITISEFKRGGSLTRIIYIKEARWTGDSWELFSIYTPGGESKEEIIIEGTPWDFSREQKKSEEMNIRELREYIRTLRKRGDPVKGELVELYSKISFPLATFIIALIGAPLALGIGRGGFFLNFGISIAIAFTYWGTISLGKSLGKGGMLPSLLSAWIANLIFAAIGIYLIYRART
jgi:lipopolysaccharide export system permease protein